MKASKGIIAPAIAALACFTGSALGAATIFDNSVHDLNTRFNPGTYEVGDEIELAGAQRNLTSFAFEYWGNNTANPARFAGAVEARVRFYMNDGTPFNGYATPGTAFFDSGGFTLPGPTDGTLAVFNFAGLFLPTSDMTWSVQFSGMGATDSAGVAIYAPPVIGADYPDYWVKEGGNWTLRINDAYPVDFAATLAATTETGSSDSNYTLSFPGYVGASAPEPASLAVLGLGAVGLLMRRRRKA